MVHKLIISVGLSSTYPNPAWNFAIFPCNGSAFKFAGPKARALLSQITNIDLSTEAFPFMSVRQGEVGLTDAIVQRVSYTA